MSLSGKRVRLTKLGVTKNPHSPTPEWKDYKVGEYNLGQSLPVEYWIEGMICQSAIKILLPVLINRDIRNGVKSDGYLKTSPVQSIEEKDGVTLFTTENSVYRLEILD